MVSTNLLLPNWLINGTAKVNFLDSWKPPRPLAMSISNLNGMRVECSNSISPRYPTVTDLTIVVIELKHLADRPIAAFTNNEITMIPIVCPVGRYINGRNDCTLGGHVGLSSRVREYWLFAGPKALECCRDQNQEGLL